MLPRVEEAITRIQKNIPGLPYGFNLIHSPHDPSMERGVVELYIQRGVKLAEASAFLDLTVNVIRFRTHGIHRAPNGEIVTPNRLIAKVSRVEVASKFFSPPSAKFLTQLVEQGLLTQDQAKLAEQIPVAQDLTAEADSGGHTDNRPAVTLIPTMLALRDRMMAANTAAARRASGAFRRPVPPPPAARWGRLFSSVQSTRMNRACASYARCWMRMPIPLSPPPTV
jgi:PfaD family protein